MTTTNILSKTISTAAALLLCGLTAHAAILMNGSTSGAGEIFVGFRATTSGSTGADKNIVIDIGSSFTLSQLTSAGSPLFLGNLGTNLAIYNDGTLGNWYNRTDLLWSAVSAVGATAISGQDPTNTLYGGVANPTGSGPVTTMSYTRAGSLSQQGIAGNILSMASGTQGFAAAPAGATSNIAVENTGDSNSWSSKFATTPFNNFTQPPAQQFEQAFTLGMLAPGVEGALDFYRMFKTGTADNDMGGATTGAGSYQFTLGIDSTGAVTAEALPAAVPEPASLGGLFSAALLGIGALRRKRGTKA